MRVSIVICTLNRAALLPRLLGALREQAPADGDEVIVVDNGSTDDTAEIVTRAAAASAGFPIRYQLEPEQGLSHARNRGITASSGEIVAFIDDDALPEPGWLAAHRDAYRHDRRVGAVGGPIQLLFETERPRWVTRSFEQLLGLYDLGPTRRLYAVDTGHETPSGGNMSFRRTTFDEIGLFDPELGRRGEDFLAGEEYELAHRLFAAGWRAVYEPTAAVRHLVPASRLRVAFFRNRMRWNVSTTESLGAKGFARLAPRVEARNLLANVVYDTGRVIGSRRAGDRLYYALRIESHLVRARRLVARA
jgi:glycosyltransferase involved in cell wall biosynthesis